MVGALLGYQNALTRRQATITGPATASGYPVERQYNGRAGSVTRTSAASSGSSHDLMGNDSDSWGAPGVTKSIGWTVDVLQAILDDPTSYRWWRVRLGDTAWVIDLGEALPVGAITVARHNLASDWTSIDYVEIGQIGLWLVAEADRPADLNEVRSQEDLSLAAIGPFGSRIVRDRNKPRTMTMNLSRMRTPQALYWRRLLREAGSDGRVWICGDPVNRATDGVQGIITTLPEERLTSEVGWERSLTGLTVLEDL